MNVQSHRQEWEFHRQLPLLEYWDAENVIYPSSVEGVCCCGGSGIVACYLWPQNNFAL